MKVLVVEDEPILCELIYEELMLEFGSRLFINTFMNSTEALEKAREVEFDIVISDCNMPVMSGDKLMASMQEMPTMRNAAYIMISGYPEVAARKLGQLGVVAEVLEKPIHYDRLFNLVRNVLESKKTP